MILETNRRLYVYFTIGYNLVIYLTTIDKYSISWNILNLNNFDFYTFVKNVTLTYVKMLYTLLTFLLILLIF